MEVIVICELKQLDKLNVQLTSNLCGHDFVEVEPCHVINNCNYAVTFSIIFVRGLGVLQAEATEVG